MKLTRRVFLAASGSAAAWRAAPTLVRQATGGRHILTLVYDKKRGMMRAIDRWVP